MGRRSVVAVGAVLVPVFLTACGVTHYLSVSYASDCLKVKRLMVTKGTLLVPEDLKTGPLTRKVTKLDVQGGPKDQFGFGNHVVVIVTASDSDIGSAIISSNALTRPPWAPKGAYIAGYRRFVAVWDTNPTLEQAKLVEGCFH